MDIARVIILVFLAFSILPAHAAQGNRVYTEKGVPLYLTEIEYGAITVKSTGIKEQIGVDDFGQPIHQYRGRQLELDGKSTLPIVVGKSFGIRFRVPDIPENDRLVLEVETVLPAEILVNGEMIDRTIDQVILTPESSGSLKSIHWTLQPDNQAFHLPGNWTINLYSGNSRAYRKVLRLY